MEKETVKDLQNIQLKLPVKIKYIALEESLKRKMVGEVIKDEDKDGDISNYAEILDVGLNYSLENKFDLAIAVTFKTLTTLFHGKKMQIVLHASLYLNKEKQSISIKEYKIKGKTANFLTNGFLQTLVNTLLYKKIKEKLSFNFMPIIEEQIKALNNKLINNLEVAQGISISGYLNKFLIDEIVPIEEELILSILIEGLAFVNIEELPD